MKNFLNIPTLTFTLLFAAAQPTLAQSGNKADAKSNTVTPKGAGTSLGNDSDISGGTTNANSKNDNPKAAKKSGHCTANEDFVKQGEHMVCVPRTAHDHGQPMGKETK